VSLLGQSGHLSLEIPFPHPLDPLNHLSSMTTDISEHMPTMPSSGRARYLQNGEVFPLPTNPVAPTLQVTTMSMSHEPDQTSVSSASMQTLTPASKPNARFAEPSGKVLYRLVEREKR
jgi:hypothetical protein